VTVGGVVLAAGRSSRFGSPKALANLDGRPLLEHVLDIAAAAGLDPVVVVLGDAAEAVEPAISWRRERRVRNPDPARGLSSSVRLGLDTLAEIDAAADAVILPGDQPRADPSVIRRLVDVAAATDRPIVAPRYAGGGGPNPVLLRRAGFGLAEATEGDRGLGPLLEALPHLVAWVDVEGSNPDVDTPADLTALPPSRD
jgi:molybdenum cofactor cytidylyltransferase